VFSGITALSLPDNPDQLPFGRSVAFIVGVSRYKNLDPLPGVVQSVQQVRDYLLKDGGFDVVYELTDFDVKPNVRVRPTLVKDYMLNRFATELGRNDRLLFYFAGHGTDKNASTGYLLFRDASKDKFDDNYLSTNDIREWSAVIRARHILFLLDACSAGFGFGAAPQGGDIGVLTALGESKSREIITAGTGRQETFDVEGASGTHLTAFGAAFLAALKNSSASEDFKSLITTDRLFTDLTAKELAFSNTSGLPLKPGRYPLLNDADGRGEFVFPNPLAKGQPPPAYLANALHGAGGTSGELALASMLQYRSAAQDQLSKDPILAYALGATAYKLRPDTTNKRLLLSAVSKLHLFYRLQMDDFLIEDIHLPLMLLASNNKSGDKKFVVFDTRTLKSTDAHIDADHAWIMPTETGWNILGRTYRSLDTRPVLRLWNSDGVQLGDAVEQAGVGWPEFIEKSVAKIPLLKAKSYLIWNLIADHRESVPSSQAGDSDAYFASIYGALDTRSDGDSAIHYRQGLMLEGKDGVYKEATYTPVSFDPAFSSGSWSPDGQYLALRYSEQQRLGIWNPLAKSFVWLDPDGWVVDSYAWSSVGHTLAFAGRHDNQTDVTVELADASKPTESRKVIYKTIIPMRCLAFADGDRKLIAADRDRSLLLIDAASGKLLDFGEQEGTTKVFSLGDTFYTSSSKGFRIWSARSAPAEAWTFESTFDRKYLDRAAADNHSHLLAVPFRDNGKKTGVEVREVASGKVLDVLVPDSNVMDILFSGDDRWLVVETSKNIRIFNTQSWEYSDISLEQDDRQFLRLRLDGMAVHAYVIGKGGGLGGDGGDFEYAFILPGSRPILPSRTALIKGDWPENKRQSPSDPSDVMGDMQAWANATLYKYRSAGVSDSSNTGWGYFIGCRSEPLGANDCDVQFIPRDIQHLMEIYDPLLWKPSAEQLKAFIQTE
jgi:WD40 repeat protein